MNRSAGTVDGAAEAAPDTYFATLLAGRSRAWSSAWDAQYAAWIRRARFHGVAGLLHERYSQEPALVEGVPEALRTALRDTATAQAMWEIRHRALLADVLAALTAAGAEPLLFKGTALAYDLYAAPSLRARGDTDLIIHPARMRDAFAALQALGYTRALGVGGEFASYQTSFTWHGGGHGVHSLDVHWRISNSQVLAPLFTHAELDAAAIKLPVLSPHARVVGHEHALLIACMHRAVHRNVPYYADGMAHLEADRLIWLYDLHLLLTQMSADALEQTRLLAAGKGLCAVLLDGVQRSRHFFDTAVPTAWLDALAAVHGEAASAYLVASARRQLWLDLCALPGLGARLRFLREHLFPDADYLRAKFPDRVHQPLWRLHLQRIAGGLGKRR